MSKFWYNDTLSLVFLVFLYKEVFFSLCHVIYLSVTHADKQHCVSDVTLKSPPVLLPPHSDSSRPFSVRGDVRRGRGQGEPLSLTETLTQWPDIVCPRRYFKPAEYVSSRQASMRRRSSSNASGRSSTLRRRSENLRFDEFGFAVLTKRKDVKLHHRCHEYRCELVGCAALAAPN